MKYLKTLPESLSQRTQARLKTKKKEKNETKSILFETL